MVKSTWKTLLLISLFFLAGCSSPAAIKADVTAAPPALDLNVIRTQVAATVLAQIPQICALTPSATPHTPATVVEATATTAPVANATQTPTTATGNAATAVSTATVVQFDQARWVTQNVIDGTTFAPGADFVMVWQLQNVGNTIWTTGYRLRYFAGETFGAPKEIALDKEVKPNETVEISVAMKAPTRPGKYRSDWVMSNESLRNFNQPIFLSITVPTPTTTPTITRTPAPTLSATPTATP
jgi:Ig-like domain from next to BRCA1 gene